jgi:hypothetical protein
LKPPEEIERQPVASTNLASYGYDADSQTLVVEFRSGAIWSYAGVPEEVYTHLRAKQEWQKAQALLPLAEREEEHKAPPSAGVVFSRRVKVDYPGKLVRRVGDFG